jgi:ribosomal protein L21E
MIQLNESNQYSWSLGKTKVEESRSRSRNAIHWSFNGKNEARKKRKYDEVEVGDMVSISVEWNEGPTIREGV